MLVVWLLLALGPPRCSSTDSGLFVVLLLGWLVVFALYNCNDGLLLVQEKTTHPQLCILEREDYFECLHFKKLVRDGLRLSCVGVCTCCGAVGLALLVWRK